MFTQGDSSLGRINSSLVLIALSLAAFFPRTIRANEQFAKAKEFLGNHCADCHNADYSEGGFDISTLQGDLASEPEFERWVEIHDRVSAGEMPPKDASELQSDTRNQFVEQTKHWLHSTQEARYAESGRVRGRRLSNLQLERSLHDLLGIDVPLKVHFPEEPRVEGFTSVADGQTMSHFQLEDHLNVVDMALDEAFEKGLYEDNSWTKTLDAKTLSRRRPKSRTREPELIDGFAVTWSSGLTFYGRLPSTTAKEPGWYRFTVKAKALKQPKGKGVWCTVRSGRHISSSPIQKWIGAFEATEDVREWTFVAWLEEREMLEIRPGDITLDKARFKGGQVGPNEGGPQDVPGIALESIVMEKFHRKYEPNETRRMLFGDLEKRWNKEQKEHELVTDQPLRDLSTLLERFAAQAFRRPLEPGVIDPYFELAKANYEKNQDFLDALRVGYRAILCSPRFLYLQEEPGKLDDYEIATRLSYFLWNATPDDELRDLARQEKLSEPKVLEGQVQRMLNDKKGETFVRDFADAWLDLRLIDFNEPDRRLYPGFDVIVQQSMAEETILFLEKLLKEDLSVTNLIDSDFTFLNSRLARHYNLARDVSDKMVPVSLTEKDHRGGLITQGSILKVTANGTNTSPVIRGVWLNERILGEKIPAPPSNVPAIEPDIRGATTIREMLEKHKSNDSCASCHVKIDPPGFALENFDPAGQWRDKYVTLKGRKRQAGAEIDVGYEMPNGKKFDNLQEFQQLVTSNPEKLAENMAEKLLLAGTGARINFADREELEAIVEEAEGNHYGLRTILKEVVTSPLFLTK